LGRKNRRNKRRGEFMQNNKMSKMQEEVQSTSTDNSADRIIEGVELTSEDLVWIDYQDRKIINSLDSVLRGGNAILTSSSIVLSIFLTAIALTKMNTNYYSLLPILALTISVIFCVTILFPYKFTFYNDCPDSIKKSYKTLLNKKYIYLKYATLSWFLGLIFTILFFMLSNFKIWG